MTIYEQLGDPLLGKRRLTGRYLTERGDKTVRYESSYEVEYRGFVLRREPEYQLWEIIQDGQQVTGLHGKYMSVSILFDGD
jgi:hypothetical protein